MPPAENLDQVIDTSKIFFCFDINATLTTTRLFEEINRLSQHTVSQEIKIDPRLRILKSLLNMPSNHFFYRIRFLSCL